MVHSLSRPPATIALLDDESDVVTPATCPMCHTRAPLTQSAVDAGDAWRCVRCGQHWNAARLAAVAAYAAWVVDREGRRSERAQEAAQYRAPAAERLDSTP